MSDEVRPLYEHVRRMGTLTHRLEVRLALDPGTEDRERERVVAREQPRRNGRDGRGADSGDAARVQERDDPGIYDSPHPRPRLVAPL